MDTILVTTSLQKSNSAASLLTHKRLRPQTAAATLTTNQTQKSAINRILKELSSDSTGDIQSVLQRPHIQKMFKQEFKMNDQEVADMQTLILQQCEDIVLKAQQTGQPAKKIVMRKSTSTARLEQATLQQAKSQPLTLLQRKEVERQQTLDYFSFPAQPCVRSLYYLSKIAQTQSLKIIVPPTILIGFGDDNRIIYNDYHSGKLVVESKNISPKKIQNFIQSHMISSAEQNTYSTEDKLLYPKFVIKLAAKGSTHNETKLYYSRESLIADLLSFWGNYDIALQAFIKQKHPFRPCIYRCYMNKNGNVYKAVAINNQENVNKEHKFYKTLLQLISDTHMKSRLTYHQRVDSQNKDKQQQSRIINSNIPYKQRNSILIDNTRHRPSIIESSILSLFTNHLSSQTLGGDPGHLNKQGFPSSLDQFKVNDYYNEIQQSMPNSELKKAFICTSDFIDNLTMMNCRPSALQQATNMTMDVYRLFSQYYLKIQKFGNVSQFICDFMEDHNGLMYFLQVKSFECEGILYDWQVPFNPMKSLKLTLTQEQLKQAEEDQYMQDLINKCQAQILCKTPKHRDQFIQACKDNDLWEFNLKKAPMCSERLISKYRLELELGKDSFCLQSEKSRISSLFPLTTFCDRNIQQQSTCDSSFEVGNENLPVCMSCYKILELYQARYYALVFKTEQTVDELRKLKLRLSNHWTADNFQFLARVYKESKKSLYIVSDIDKIEKRVFEQSVRERAKSPESVMRRRIKNVKRQNGSSSYYYGDGMTMATSSRNNTTTFIDTMDNNNNSRKISTADTQIRVKRSSSAFRFKKHPIIEEQSKRPMSGAVTQRAPDTITPYLDEPAIKKQSIFGRNKSSYLLTISSQQQSYTSSNKKTLQQLKILQSLGGMQKSDRDMNEYFNNKRELNKHVIKSKTEPPSMPESIEHNNNNMHQSCN